MSCCGQHLRNDGPPDSPLGPGIILPSDPCVFCAEKHLEYARRLCEEYGYTDANRGDAIGELVACQNHLWKTGHWNVANAVRIIRGLLQLRRDKEIVWTHAAQAIRALASAAAEKLLENQPTDKKEA